MSVCFLEFPLVTDITLKYNKLPMLFDFSTCIVCVKIIGASVFALDCACLLC